VNGCPIACGQWSCDHQARLEDLQDEVDLAKRDLRRQRADLRASMAIPAIPLLEPDGPVWQITTLEA
jgi:hypothetical protein